MRESLQVIIDKYQQSLLATAFNVCKSIEDAEDVVQETFIKYHFVDKDFESSEHIKSWLLRVAINRAKNVNLAFWRKNKRPIDDYIETLVFETEGSGELFQWVMRLPDKYRMVIHLFYYEDYSVLEIADILRLSESNVKVRLSRGRKLLKEWLKEEWDNE